MSNMKKSFLTVVSLMFAAVMLCSCGGKEAATDKNITVDENGRKMIGNMYVEGLPLVKDTVELTVACEKPSYLTSYSEMPIVREMEKKTNVKINWVELPTDNFNEKLNLMFASEEFPDIMWKRVNNNLLTEYGVNGNAIIPLNDLIDEYAPNWQKWFEKYPNARKIATAPDGNIYSLPSIRDQKSYSSLRDALFINSEWLDKLGLEVPKTTEEFKNVLKAFKEQDPNGNGVADEIPWTFTFGNYVSGEYDMYSAFGAHMQNNENIMVRAGKVVYVPVTKEFKNAVAYMHELYAEGLIDPESFTQNWTQARAKVATENPAITGFYTAYSYGNNSSKPMLPLKGPDGTQGKVRSQSNTVTSGMFTIFSKNPYPEISMRWANEWAADGVGVHTLFGPLKESKNGKYIPAEENSSVQAAPNSMGPFVINDDMISKTLAPEFIAADVREELYNFYKGYVADQSEIYPAVFYTPEQTDEIALYASDIKEYVKKTVAEFITNGGIDEGWESYVAQVEKMGLSDLLSIYQEAYDQYNER